MATLFGAFPFLTRLFVDGGYQGPQFKGAIRRTLAAVTVEIVKRSGAKTFVVLPKRCWIVERTLAWLGRCRRLAKDWECLNRKALAFLRLASIRLDRHHRAAAALRVAQARGEKDGYFRTVPLPQQQMTILDYNRELRDLNGRTPDEVLTEIGGRYAVDPSDQPVRPTRADEVGMFLGGAGIVSG